MVHGSNYARKAFGKAVEIIEDLGREIKYNAVLLTVLISQSTLKISVDTLRTVEKNIAADIICSCKWNNFKFPIKFTSNSTYTHNVDFRNITRKFQS